MAESSLLVPMFRWADHDGFVHSTALLFHLALFQVQNNIFSSNILFFSLAAGHSGSYTCLATNAAAAANFTAQLIVRGDI